MLTILFPLKEKPVPSISAQGFQDTCMIRGHLSYWSEIRFLNLKNVMPSLHLPLAPCDEFGYDFYAFFSDTVGGYGLRHLCLHYVLSSCHFLSLAVRGTSVRRLCGGYTEIVPFQCSCRAVFASFP